MPQLESSEMSASDVTRARATTIGLTVVLFFTSGFTGLVYEVLWMKELGLLFGNTAHAAATTLVAFFLGLAAGGWFWGRRAVRIRRPLRAYAALEAGVAASALFYFGLQRIYYVVYPPLYDMLGNAPGIFAGVKLVLGVLILFPPAFFMGGTLPMVSQHLVRHAERLGRTSSALYFVNTMGAAGGAYMAGVHLPVWLGFRNAYLSAIALTAAVAAVAWLAGGEEVGAPEASSLPAPANRRNGPAAPPWSAKTVAGLAFLSGFLTLALQVLWTHMFAQVLHNSVYTFSAILVAFLLCLAAGAGLANRLMSWCRSPANLLHALLLLSGLFVSVSPFVFMSVSEGMDYLGSGENWVEYIRRVFVSVGAVILLPCLCMGTVFPMLLKLSEARVRVVGRTVGRLAAVNTAGGILGAVCAGFLLLEWLGLWGALRMAAAAYLLSDIALWLATPGQRVSWLSAAPAAALVLVLTIFDPGRLPLVSIDPLEERERLLEVWQGSAGTVAVVEKGGHLKIKVNNFYTLGGSGARHLEQLQTHIPLLMHPAPKTVFFLGMGTGITAGAALSHPVERVVVSELLADAVRASRKYFGPYLNGLFEDRRAQVVVEDGRNYLMASRERFDLILGDLFVPWKAGTGSLYTREHFQAAKLRLHAHGLFVQWIPLYQTTEREVAIIARTMRAVFPRVSVWRGDFLADRPVLAFAGHRERAPLRADVLARHLEPSERDRDEHPELRGAPLLFYYCGNLDVVADWIRTAPLNTDNRPVIEYRAPQSQRAQKAGETRWFNRERLMRFQAELHRLTPPERDPLLERATPQQRAYVHAGRFLHASAIFQELGYAQEAAEAMQMFRSLVRPELNSTGE